MTSPVTQYREITVKTHDPVPHEPCIIPSNCMFLPSAKRTIAAMLIGGYVFKECVESSSTASNCVIIILFSTLMTELLHAAIGGIHPRRVTYVYEPAWQKID